MTTIRGTRSRIALLSLGALALLLALVAAAPLFLSGDLVRERVVARLEAATGTAVRMSRSHVTLFPRPRVVMENVRLDLATDTSLKAAEARIDRLEVDVAWLPVLRGRIEPANLTAVRPHVKLHDADPAALAVRMRETAWPDVTVTDGRVEWHVHKSARKRTALVSAVEATLVVDMPGVTAQGSAVWNGEPVRFDLSTADLPKLITARAPFTATIEASPVTLSFDGRTGLVGGEAKGTMRVATPSLERAAAWLNLPLDARDLPTVPLSLAGEIVRHGDGLTFETARVMVDGREGEGSLDISWTEGLGRGGLALDGLALGGTLAFDAVAWTPRVQTLPAWSRLLGRLDLDLRLSAGSARWGEMVLSDVAATLRSEDDTVALDVTEARLGTGRARGRFRLHPEHRHAWTMGEAEVALSNIDLIALAPLLPAEAPRLTGTGDLTADLTVPLKPDATMRDWRGRITLAARNGTVERFDLRRAARAARHRLLPRQEEVWTRATPFTRLDAAVEIGDGGADLSEAKLVGPRLSAGLAGRIELEGGGIALSGSVTDRERDGSDSFFVGGTVTTPLLVPTGTIAPPPQAFRGG